MRLEEAKNTAAWILGNIKYLCERIMVVGSIRRERPEVNDIDIVIMPMVPRLGNWNRIAKELRHLHNMSQVKKGPKLMTFDHHDRDAGSPGFFNPSSVDWSVDIYRAEPEDWGILVLVRTGSKEHNVRLCNLALSKGMKLSAAQGLLKPVDTSGLLMANIACKTEEEIFAALGLAFVEPKDREVS